MDLLFSKYANPYLLVNNLIEANEFDTWVMFFIRKYNNDENEKAMWELYLHKDFESESFNEFKTKAISSSTSERSMDEAEKQNIIDKSADILNGFNPLN